MLYPNLIGQENRLIYRTLSDFGQFAGTPIFIRVARLADNASDTLAADAKLVSVEISYS